MKTTNCFCCRQPGRYTGLDNNPYCGLHLRQNDMEVLSIKSSKLKDELVQAVLYRVEEAVPIAAEIERLDQEYFRLMRTSNSDYNKKPIG